MNCPPPHTWDHPTNTHFTLAMVDFGIYAVYLNSTPPKSKKTLSIVAKSIFWIKKIFSLVILHWYGESWIKKDKFQRHWKRIDIQKQIMLWKDLCQSENNVLFPETGYSIDWWLHPPQVHSSLMILPVYSLILRWINEITFYVYSSSDIVDMYSWFSWCLYFTINGPFNKNLVINVPTAQFQTNNILWYSVDMLQFQTNDILCPATNPPNMFMISWWYLQKPKIAPMLSSDILLICSSSSISNLHPTADNGRLSHDIIVSRWRLLTWSLSKRATHWLSGSHVFPKLGQLQGLRACSNIGHLNPWHHCPSV